MTRRPIRVMLVSPLPPPVGGIATWTRLVLNTPVDDDIHLIHVDSAVGGEYGARLTAGKLVRQLMLTLRVCWRITTEKPDVIHVTTSYGRGWRRDALFLTLARRVGGATIVNFRGGDLSAVYTGMPAGRRNSMLRQLQQCDAVVPITEESACFLRQLGLTTVQMIPNCIDVRVHPPRIAGASLRRWLFVGHVAPAKGLPELFEALRRFPDARLTVIGPIVRGGGNDHASVMALAQGDAALAGRITHLDAMLPEKVRDAYSDHDLFIFPTRREGFPNAVLEAMEAALPIVATHVGAIPDMIVDGEHGLLVPLGDQAALETAIARVTSDPELAARLGASARARVTTLYEVRQIVATWCRLYRAAHARIHPADA